MRLGIEAGAHTLDVAVEHGIRGVPIAAANLVGAGVEATLAPLRERGLRVCQIGAFGFNPLSVDVARQAQQRAIVEQAIPLAGELGCRYIVVCGGNYHPSGFAAGDPRNFAEAALDEAARGLAPVVALAEKHGAIIAIEPYLKTAVNTPERFLALREKVGSDVLRANWDATSLYTYMDMWDATRVALRTCNLLAGHYALAHIKEVSLREGFHIHIDLAPIGGGPTDWAAVLPFIEAHLPEDSWAILEHAKSPEEARVSLAALRAMAESAGVTLE